MNERFALYTSTKGVTILPPFYYPLTGEGLERAKSKRAELMARYPSADVELEISREPRRLVPRKK